MKLMMVAQCFKQHECVADKPNYGTGKSSIIDAEPHLHICWNAAAELVSREVQLKQVSHDAQIAWD